MQKKKKEKKRKEKEKRKKVVVLFRGEESKGVTNAPMGHSARRSPFWRVYRAMFLVKCWHFVGFSILGRVACSQKCYFIFLEEQ